MAKFYQADLQNSFISLDVFSNSNENQRFPTLSEEEVANLRSKNKNKTPPRVQNLTKSILRHKLDAIIVVFFAEIRRNRPDGGKFKKF